MPPDFTLAVVTSLDGFIARTPDHPPQVWACPEEQALFFRDVEAADWAIMGRNTHLAADKPQRRRIIFSSAGHLWDRRRPTQLWLDPATLAPADLAAAVAHVHPLRSGLILGGTAVHDWFHAHAAIARVHLTIEPVHFGTGLPVFSTQPRGEDPLTLFQNRGYRVISERPLNDEGTRYLVLVRGQG